MSASLHGHVEVVDRLVQHGAKVDLKKEVNFIFLLIGCFCLLRIYYMSNHV